MVNFVQPISVVLTVAVAIFKARALQTLGGALIFMGVWNLVYFILYYKNPQKIGVPFTVSLLPALAVMVMDAVVMKMVPFLRDNHMTPDPENIFDKLVSGKTIFCDCDLNGALFVTPKNFKCHNITDTNIKHHVYNMILTGDIGLFTVHGC